MWKAAGSDLPERGTRKEAPHLLAQKAAVDLLATKERRRLTRGVLEFASPEYARRADSPLAAVPAVAEARKELLALAKEYEALAGKRNP